MAVEKKSRGSYSAGLATRESILVAAMTLISRAGYHGFSLRDVGRMVGISHPAVIYHYPSKEALLLAVVQRYEESFGLVATRIDETSGVLVEGGIIPADIAQMAIAMMRVAKRDDARTIMDLDCILAVEAASPDHPAHDHFAHRFDIIHEFLESEVARLAGTLHVAKDGTGLGGQQAQGLLLDGFAGLPDEAEDAQRALGVVGLGEEGHAAVGFAQALLRDASFQAELAAVRAEAAAARAAAPVGR